MSSKLRKTRGWNEQTPSNKRRKINANDDDDDSGVCTTIESKNDQIKSNDEYTLFEQLAAKELAESFNDSSLPIFKFSEQCNNDRIG